MTKHTPATPLPTSWLDLPQSVSEPVAKELIRRSNAYPRLVAALRQMVREHGNCRNSGLVAFALLAELGE